MRTNIEIDDELMPKALRSSGKRTKRAVVDEGLRLLVRIRAQAKIRRLRDKARWEGDLEVSRASRVAQVETRAIIVYTTVWIDYFGAIRNAESDWLDRELGQQPLGLTDLILCEVLQGYRDDATFAPLLNELLRLDVFERAGPILAVAAAKNLRHLRKRGFTVRKNIDCWIATFCILEGHALLHRNRDSNLFEKVLVHR